MTNEQKQVKDWMMAFGQEAPEKPTIPSLEVRKLRAKLILEEALETIEALGVEIKLVLDNKAEYFMPSFLLEHLSIGREMPTLVTLEAIADGCSDLKVVTEGTLVACGLIDKTRPTSMVESALLNNFNDPLFDEVMRSNWTKFWKDKDMLNPSLAKNLTFYRHEPRISLLHYAKNKDGKVIKSPSYSPANLQPIIDELSK